MYQKMDCKRNDKGFTLIDVIISLALLGLVFMPLMGYYTSSTYTNYYAKNLQKASLAAQTVVEELNTCNSLQEIAMQFNDPSRGEWKELDFSGGTYVDTMNPSYSISGGVGVFSQKAVYYYKRPIEIDGEIYQAIIKLDTQGYSAAVDNRPSSNTVIAYNTLDIPVISSLIGDGVCLAVEGIQESTAVSSFLSFYLAYRTEQLLLGNIIPAVDEAMIRADLVRNVHISFTPEGDPGDVRVKVTYQYHCPNITGLHTPVESEPLYNEKVDGSKLSDLYLFYRSKSLVDNFILTDNTVSEITGKYSIHLVCQEVAGSLPEVSATVSGADVTDLRNLNYIYSNVSVTLNGIANGEKPLISHTKKQRLADITVSIFEERTGKQIVEMNTIRVE